MDYALRSESLDESTALPGPLVQAVHRLQNGTCTVFVGELTNLVYTPGYNRDIAAQGTITRFGLPVFDGYNTQMAWNEITERFGKQEPLWTFSQKGTISTAVQDGLMQQSTNLESALKSAAGKEGVILKQDILDATIKAICARVIDYYNSTLPGKKRK